MGLTAHVFGCAFFALGLRMLAKGNACPHLTSRLCLLLRFCLRDSLLCSLPSLPPGEKTWLDTDMAYSNSAVLATMVNGTVALHETLGYTYLRTLYWSVQVSDFDSVRGWLAGWLAAFCWLRCWLLLLVILLLRELAFLPDPHP